MEVKGILREEPAWEDEVGSHGRVAARLAKFLKREEGGRCVAVVGDRGAGKSTVINLLFKKLSDSGFLCFRFNAWAHDVGMLRGVFLSSLYSFLKRERLFTEEVEEELERKLREITGRVSVERRRTEFSTSALTYFLALYLLVLYPLSVRLISSGNGWQVGVGIFFLALPLLLAVFTGGKVLPYLVRRSDEREVLVEREGPLKPRSEEFLELLAEVLDSAVGSYATARGRDLRLVVAFDDLDWAGVESAGEVFSQIKVFVFGDAVNRYPILKKVWFVFGIDEDGIMRRLRKLESGGSFPENFVDEREFAGFLEKFFAAKFYVPALPPHGWRSFFLKKCAEVLGEGRWDRVADVFLTVAKRAERTITPRLVKWFVNQLAVVHGSVEGVPPSHTAVYVGLRTFLGMRDEEVVEAAEKDEIPLAEEFDAVVGGDWRSSVVAFALGVSVEEVALVLLGEEGWKRMLEGEKVELPLLKSESGVVRIRDLIAERSGEVKELSVVGRLALAVPEEEELLRILKELAENCGELGEFDKKAGSGLGKLLRRFPESGFARKVVDLLALGSGEKWAEGAVEVAETLDSVGFAELLSITTFRPFATGDPLRTAEVLGAKWLPTFADSEDLERLAEVLAERLEEEDGERFLKSLDLLLPVFPAPVLHTLVNDVGESLGSGKGDLLGVYLRLCLASGRKPDCELVAEGEGKGRALGRLLCFGEKEEGWEEETFEFGAFDAVLEKLLREGDSEGLRRLLEASLERPECASSLLKVFHRLKGILVEDPRIWERFEEVWLKEALEEPCAHVEFLAEWRKRVGEERLRRELEERGVDYSPCAHKLFGDGVPSLF